MMIENQSTMFIDIHDTMSLVQTIEQIKPPARFLVDTFFPNIMPTSLNETVAVEYRKFGRTLAPYVIPGAHAMNVGRTGSVMKVYSPPILGARRILSPSDIIQRDFGENIVNASFSAEERAGRIQARDLSELSGMIENRKNQMASEILTTGKLTLRGFADDGVTPRDDSISFDWNGQITPSIPWNQANADIYGDIQRASEKIQEEAGMIPTVMICGKNVANYLINNAQILKWLSIPSRENFALMTMQPRLESPQIMRIGIIQSLNLEIYSYFETYQDENGDLQSYLGSNQAIIGIPKLGSQLYGAIPILEQGSMQFKTYAARMIPVYQANHDAQVVSLTVFSRCILVPTMVDTWTTINVLESNQVTTGSENETGSEINSGYGSDVSLPGL